jgi:hypothetical protein
VFCSSPWSSSGSLCFTRGNPEVRKHIRSCLDSRPQRGRRFEAKYDLGGKSILSQGLFTWDSKQSEQEHVFPLDTAEINWPLWHCLNSLFPPTLSLLGSWGA